MFEDADSLIVDFYMGIKDFDLKHFYTISALKLWSTCLLAIFEIIYPVLNATSRENRSCLWPIVFYAFKLLVCKSTFCLISAIWSGVTRQHPPIHLNPILRQLGMNSAIFSDVPFHRPGLFDQSLE